MTARPEALRVARRWMAKAEEDLAAAERLLSLDDSLTAVVCFHGQQAVEKLLKALLASPVCRSRGPTTSFSSSRCCLAIWP